MAKKAAQQAPPGTPPLEEWHQSTAEGPALIGARCRACGCYFFPPWQLFACGNPACEGDRDQLEKLPLSRTGTLWSWTVNHYPPPPPYPAQEPFVPYATVAVQLEKEKIRVLGLLHPDSDAAQLRAGLEMELALAPLAAGSKQPELWHWRTLPRGKSGG